ncbi:hypothetical protein ABPG75_001807 [Micractinium tetrahymenae]
MQAAPGQLPPAAAPPSAPPAPASSQQAAFPLLAPELAPLAIAAALADSSVVAAALAEAQQRLGCAKCRYSRGGCARCRNPSFKPRPAAAGNPRSQQQQGDGDGGWQAPAPPPPPMRAARGKRQRKAPAGPAGQGSSGEPLVHALRRQLQSLQTQSSSGGGRPAKFLKADAELASSLQQAHPPQQPVQLEQQQAVLPAATAGTAAAAQQAADGKRGASSEPSPSARRPSKRQRPHTSPAAANATDAASAEAAPAGEGGAEEAPAPAGPATAAAAEAGAAAKRPPPQQQPNRPAKFRRVAPPEEHQQLGQPGAQEQQQQQQPARSQGSAGSAERMEIDPLSPRKRGAAEHVAGANGVGSQAAPPSPADFLAQLEERMQLRHQERQASQGGPAQLPLLALAGSKRRKQSPKAAAPAGHSPAASLGTAGGASAAAGTAGAAGTAAAAAEEEPDPRLCLWEPPVSPFGLLEEELFEDPWKLLVACMLLNKTSGTQVRKVIWELFSLCPTPAAAIAADVQQVQNLIQPLGLFRKRALAIQQLSHDYLYKQWRNPTELFGIGKYAADAYLMFCRGRWREVQPDDKDLKRYRDWLEQTGGLGTGLTRHRTMPPAAAAGAIA